MRRRAGLLVVAAGALVAGALPVVAAPASAVAPRQSGKPVTVTVGDNFYKPKRVTITAGDTVRWVNKGRSVHDIVPNKGHKFGIGTLAPGKKYKFTFDEPGKYPYYCSIHGAPGKVQYGTIKVKPKPPPPPESSVPPTAPASAAPLSKSFATSRAQSPARRTIEVPADVKTVQGAVDRAKPGDLVLVSPGVYEEAVTITTPRIVLRGVDRNRTILDGKFELENGVKVLEADGVAVENLTARNFQVNGFYWVGVDGYRGSYLSAVRNGSYGIYAFDSKNGRLDHSYGAGNPDSAFYIGQCFPCNAVISDVEAEWNGIGYSGTNAGGALYVVKSSWHDNRVGIVPNSGSGEKLYPQHGTTLAGNDVRDNNNGKTAGIELAVIATGSGILLAGANDNVVEHNRVTNQDIVGIAPVPLPERIIDPDDPSKINFDARGNQVRDNVVSGSGEADLALVATITSDTDAGGNCFSGNEFETSLPANVETLVPCGSPASPSFKTELGRFATLLAAEKPPAHDYRKVELPKRKQANMPKARTAKARPATSEPSIDVDLEKIETPRG